MADESLIITLPAEIAAIVRNAVEAGDFASTSDVIRAALHDWDLHRALQRDEFGALKLDIEAGLADVSAGRMKTFDVDRVVDRGRKRFADRSPSG